MKTLVVILLAGMTYVATAPAFAGRDETQMLAMQASIQKKQAANLAQAKQSRSGLAGPAGVAGNPGPGTQPRVADRLPGSHP